MHQERAYPDRVSGTGLVNPDFAALALSYGAFGEAVELTEDFAGALDRALGHDGPALIDLRLPVERIAPGLTISALDEPELAERRAPDIGQQLGNKIGRAHV